MTYTIERITNTALYQDSWFTSEQLNSIIDIDAIILSLMLDSTNEEALKLADELSYNLLIIK